MVSTMGAIAIALVVVAVLGSAAWVVSTQLRARKLGLPPPSLSSYISFRDIFSSERASTGGVSGWVHQRLHAWKNRRTAAGAYEGARGGVHDPDDAWDPRVGQETDGYGPNSYYEEHELGGRPPVAPGLHQTSKSPYQMNLASTPPTPQPHSQPLKDGGDLERGRATPSQNPFDDSHAT